MRLSKFQLKILILVFFCIGLAELSSTSELTWSNVATAGNSTLIIDTPLEYSECIHSAQNVAEKSLWALCKKPSGEFHILRYSAQGHRLSDFSTDNLGSVLRFEFFENGNTVAIASKDNSNNLKIKFINVSTYAIINETMLNDCAGAQSIKLLKHSNDLFASCSFLSQKFWLFKINSISSNKAWAVANDDSTLTRMAINRAGTVIVGLGSSQSETTIFAYGTKNGTEISFKKLGSNLLTDITFDDPTGYPIVYGFTAGNVTHAKYNYIDQEFLGTESTDMTFFLHVSDFLNENVGSVFCGENNNGEFILGLLDPENNLLDAQIIASLSNCFCNSMISIGKSNAFFVGRGSSDAFVALYSSFPCEAGEEFSTDTLQCGKCYNQCEFLPYITSAEPSQLEWTGVEIQVKFNFQNSSEITNPFEIRIVPHGSTSYHICKNPILGAGIIECTVPNIVDTRKNRYTVQIAFGPLNNLIGESVHPVIESYYPSQLLSSSSSSYLSIHGKNLNSESIIFVGFEKYCNVILENLTSCSCNITAGVGENLPLYVISNGLMSLEDFRISFQQPFIAFLNSSRVEDESAVLLLKGGFGEPSDQNVDLVLFNETSEYQISSFTWINSSNIELNIDSKIPSGFYSLSFSSGSLKTISPINIFARSPIEFININEEILLNCDESKKLFFEVSNLLQPGIEELEFLITSNGLPEDLNCENYGQVNMTTIWCILPPVKFPGKFTLRASLSGITTRNNITVDYGPMIVTSVKANGTTAGGDLVEINGKNFGSCELNCPLPLVKIGGKECLNSLVQSNELIECLSPEGDGKNLTVEVTINSEKATLYEGFSYKNPKILSISPEESLWKENIQLTITAENFGPISSFRQFKFISASSNHSCQNLTIIDSETLTCEIRELYQDYEIYFSVGDQYSIAERPIINGIYPNTNIDTQGGQNIIVIGPELQGISDILVENESCKDVSVDSSGNIAICSVPPGVGKNMNVFVIKNGIKNSRGMMISYAAPIITYIWPKKFNGDEKMNIEITGFNFGQTGQLATVWFYSERSAPLSMEVTVVNSTFIKTQRNASMDIYNYQIKVEVGGQISVSDDFSFVNNDQNSPPNVENINKTIEQDTLAPIQLKGSDNIDQDPVTFRLSSLPKNGSIYQYDSGTRGAIFMEPSDVNDISGYIFYVPDMSFSGEDSFEFVTFDGKNYSEKAGSVKIDVRLVNVAPSFSQSIVEVFVGADNALEELTIPINDPDEDNQLNIYASKRPKRGSWFRVNSNNPLNWDSNPVPAGQDFVIRYQHDDKGGGYPFDEFELQVKDSKDAVSGNLIVRIFVRCSVGKVNNIWSDGSICIGCPVGAECSDIGETFPINAAGYFPVDNETFIQCSPADACPPGKASAGKMTGSFDCAAGYKGLRCGDCALGYYKSGDICAKCATTQLDIGLVIPIALLILAGLLVAMITIRKVDLGFFSILVTFVQTIAIFEAFQLKWPASVTEMYRIFSAFNLNVDLASPECFMGDGASQSYELKYYGTLALPLVLFTVVLTVYIFSLALKFMYKLAFPLRQKIWNSRVILAIRLMFNNPTLPVNIKPSKFNTLMRGIKKTQPLSPDYDNYEIQSSRFSLPSDDIMLHEEEEGKNPSFTASLLGGCVFALKIMYLSLSRRTLEIYNCQNDGSGNFYFSSIPSRKCYTEKWWMDLLPSSITAIIVYIVGIPVLAIFLSLKRIQTLKKPKNQRTKVDEFILQVTYKKRREFKTQFDYWDVIIMVRKFMIAASQLFFATFPAFQAVWLLMILFAAYVLQRVYLPYTVRSLNFLESVTIIASMLVLLSGLLFLNGAYYNQNVDALGFVVIFIVSICVAMMATMMLKHMVFLYRDYKIQIKEEKLKNKNMDKSKELIIE